MVAHNNQLANEHFRKSSWQVNTRDGGEEVLGSLAGGRSDWRMIKEGQRPSSPTRLDSRINLGSCTNQSQSVEGFDSYTRGRRQVDHGHVLRAQESQVEGGYLHP